MSGESTAELLFGIGADPSDAINNVAAFRQFMQRDLAGMEAEFSAWATSVVGSLNTVQGAMIASSALVGAAAVAAGAGLFAMAEKASEAGAQIYEMHQQTGLSAESLSGMAANAKLTGESADGLAHALARAGKNIAEGLLQPASQTGKMLLSLMGNAKAVTDLGLQPMDQRIQSVLQRIFQLNDIGERNAALSALMGRGFMSNVESLKLLAEQGYGPAIERAKSLGLYFDQNGARAAKQFQIATTELKAELGSFALKVGQEVIPVFVKFVAFLDSSIAFIKAWGHEAAVAAGGLGQIAGDIANGQFWQIPDRLKKMAAESKNPLDAFTAEYDHFLNGLNQMTEGSIFGDKNHHLDPKAFKDKFTEAFSGIESILDQVAARMGHYGSEEDQLRAGLMRFTMELDKQAAALSKLHTGLRVTGKEYQRQLGIVGQVQAAITKLGETEEFALGEKHTVKIAEANRELNAKLNTYAEQTTEHKMALAQNEYDDALAKLIKEKTVTAENLGLIVAVRTAALEQIDREESQKEKERETRFAAELAALDKTADSMVAKVQTGQAKIDAEYDATLVKYGKDEEAKAMLTAKTQDEVLAITKRFEAIRSAALDKWANDSQKLANSQGFSAVFGSLFQSTINRDQVLMQQWQTGGLQAIDMMRVATVYFAQTATQDMQKFNETLGSATAQAIAGEKPFGQAMAAMAKSTLDSLASQAIGYALFSTGLGFYDLALGNLPAAANAFTAAAEFAAVGGTAAAVSRFIPSSSTSTGTAAASASGSAASAAPGATSAASSAQPGTAVHLYVEGNIIGTDAPALAAALVNQAVAAGYIVNASYALKAKGTQGATH